MKFSILHPTARVTPDFAHPWWLAAGSAFDGCDHPEDVEYILVVHVSRVHNWYGFPAYNARSFGRFTLVTNFGRDCLVDQCNAAQLASRGDIFVGNQDDMRFPEHWDTEIARLVPDPSQLVCVHARTDGPRSDLLTVPTIATKVLCDRLGPLSPEYDGMYSDNEWSIKARRVAQVVSSDLYFQHLHPAWGLAEADEVHLMENREDAYKIGWKTFKRREAMGFPRVEGVPGWPKWVVPSGMGDLMAGTFAVPPLPVPRKERIIALCTPGEQHSNRWNRERDRLIFALIEAGWTPRTYWDYTTNVYHTRMGITRDIARDAESTGQAPELVLWVDDDNIPDVRAVEFLLATIQEHPEYSGAVGWCWIRLTDEKDNRVGWMPSCGNFKPGSISTLLPTLLPDLYADNAAPKQIEWSGFPLVLMRYQVLEQLGMLAFQPLFTDENEFGFTGEDTAFFVCAKEAGLKFCVDPRAKVEHLKLMPCEPDYVLPPTCDPEIAKAIEADRVCRKGERMGDPFGQKIEPFADGRTFEIQFSDPASNRRANPKLMGAAM